MMMIKFIAEERDILHCTLFIYILLFYSIHTKKIDFWSDS